ncbi:MAG: hypothetical protein GY810_30600 [Aureispira sp.]|nr:hypothetical protein [Aureispira sp.]
MRILLAFTEEEIERLFLTYKRNPKNYQKIKDRVVGEGSKMMFKKEMRGRYIFAGAVTIISLISSVYSIVAQHWGSLAAIWIVWFGAILISMGWFAVSYKNAYSVLAKNEDFFKAFEAKAKQCESLVDFKILQNTTA